MVVMETKRCFRCGEERPLEMFYAHPMMADGHLGKCIGCAREDAKRNRVANADRIRAYDRSRDRPRSLEKLHAKQAVQRATLKGFLVRGPCHVCGETENVHGHHPDYSKPLEVIWLCQAHHMAVHRRFAS